MVVSFRRRLALLIPHDELLEPRQPNLHRDLLPATSRPLQDPSYSRFRVPLTSQTMNQIRVAMLLRLLSGVLISLP